ncbi:peptidase [Tautonia plasticadhaerens]|uniref:Proteasome subunit beta n=1 Tax=Tautonia plasticadhaerens TaxID=2527974 RepID=A0A518GVN9_9BACT|nr:peptidase [Tautonia plasticadhaerens]QDV32667.1 Proteasome subunit beta [Tautonia plasticadhaerens]
MTYCLGIKTRDGLVMASDSRTNAGFDQVNVARKMHTFEAEGERVFVLLASGSLSCTQSIVTLLDREFREGRGLAAAETFYDAARAVGEQVRRVALLDREALERDDYRFNVHLILGGQIRGQPHELYLIYPQGNPLCASDDSPFLQIGECKYGRPILDRGIRFDRTTLEDASRYALISIDSTMRSNVTVGPPIDLLVYAAGELRVSRYRRFNGKDADLMAIHSQWEAALRKAVQEVPEIDFNPPPDDP